MGTKDSGYQSELGEGTLPVVGDIAQGWSRQRRRTHQAKN